MIIEEIKHLCPDCGSDQLKQNIPEASLKLFIHEYNIAACLNRCF